MDCYEHFRPSRFQHLEKKNNLRIIYVKFRFLASFEYILHHVCDKRNVIAPSVLASRAMMFCTLHLARVLKSTTSKTLATIGFSST